ncbi:sugar ABC transporter substrate-binding protein [Paenibacillus sp. CF384]|uniref:ABC transporter substrate-binding protein n=1 Tax=Paenibacillus sp. CF384 TaxID=1884382 RepID=UPI000895FA7A|nr:sugar ABC transporter substrate-binding protein [Paenibacillus sp. CF384]SDX31582.1 carbohydrate ABC transporter substrate-binding protein, CUT1 family [Paenibacillus sp. CF384]
MGSASKFVKLASLVLLTVALIAGCSSNSNNNGNKATNQNASTNDKDTSTDTSKNVNTSKETVTITYTDWANSEEAKSYRKVLDKFEELHPNIKIDYQNIPYNDYGAKLTAMAASDTLPDIGNLLEADALKWNESGKLLDLTAFYENGTVTPKIESNKFVSPDGKLLGYSIANEIILLHYNKQLFDDASLPYPPAETEKAWTWDQMLDTARKLTLDKNGKHPNDEGFDKDNIVQYGIQITTAADFFWTPFAISNGGGEVSQDGKELLLDKPETIEAIQKVADLALKEHVAPLPAQAANLGDVGQRLLTKKVAMVTSGQWELVNINPQLSQGLKNGIGVLPIFKKPATTNTGTPVVIFNTTKHKDEVVELYKYIMDPNNSQANFDSGVWMPTEANWYTDDALIKKWTASPVHPPEYRTAVIDYALKATYPTPWFFLPTYSRIGEVLNPGLDPVWLGTKTAQQAITEMMPKIQAIFDSGKAIE